jgi:hypothetical protein
MDNVTLALQNAIGVHKKPTLTVLYAIIPEYPHLIAINVDQGILNMILLGIIVRVVPLVV